MQSIHNVLDEWHYCNKTVCDISKIRNVVNSQLRGFRKCRSRHCLRYIKDTKCSQFTTAEFIIFRGHILFAIYQRYEMQSIHNMSACMALYSELFAIYQRYEMQSIHNNIQEATRHRVTVCDISKIRNVVNSQRPFWGFFIARYCLRYIKDTKCSQFTTVPH